MYNPEKNRKKNIFCGNCNKPGHTYRYCREPVISLGILLFYDPPSNHTPPLSPPNSKSLYTKSKPINIPQKQKVNKSESELAYSPSPPSSNFRPWNEQNLPKQSNEKSLFNANDSYFWIVSQMSEMDVKTAYKTHTVGTFFQGALGFFLVLIGYLIWSLFK